MRVYKLVSDFRRVGGFGALSAFAIVLAMAIIGICAGLVVRASRHPAGAKHATSSVYSIPVPKPSNTPAYTSPGYIRYTDATTGFSVAYPSGWGAVQLITGDNGTASITSGTVSLQSTQGDVLAGEQQALIIEASRAGTITMQHDDDYITSERSPTTGYVWHSSAPVGARVGPAVDMQLHTNANGLSYYDGSLAGEDGTSCSFHEYVFVVTHGLVAIRVPELCPLQQGEYISKVVKAAYLNQLKTIIDSVVAAE